jgi:hypothetical protein
MGDRSRMMPLLSRSPGFSLPTGPYRSSFIRIHQEQLMINNHTL